MSSEPKAGVVSGWRKVWSARAERYSKLRAGRLYLDRGSQSVSGELPENHFGRVTARLQWVEKKVIIWTQPQEAVWAGSPTWT